MEKVEWKLIAMEIKEIENAIEAYLDANFINNSPMSMRAHSENIHTIVLQIQDDYKLSGKNITDKEVVDGIIKLFKG